MKSKAEADAEREYERENAAAYRDFYQELEIVGKMTAAQAASHRPFREAVAEIGQHASDSSRASLPPFERVLFGLYERVIVAYKRSLVDAQLPTSTVIQRLAMRAESAYEEIYIARLEEFAQRAGFYAEKAFPEFYLGLLPQNARGQTSRLFRELEGEILAMEESTSLPPACSQGRDAAAPKTINSQKRPTVAELAAKFGDLAASNLRSQSALVPRTEPDPRGRIAKEGAIRVGRPARPEIENFAQDAFAITRDRIIEEYAEKQKSVLAQVRLTGNSGGYLPALAKWGAERVRETILAQADAYVDAFTLYGVPADRRAEKTLETAAEQIAAGAVSGILGELDLLAKRTRTLQEDSGGYLNREINRAMQSASKEGKLRLQRQRIKAKATEADPVSTLKGGEGRLAIPARPLSAISADQERRAEAQKDLKQALQSYSQTLSRAQEIDLGSLAEVWGEYAVRLYDSLAESFVGLPARWESTFGETGVLAGGQTLDHVKQALNRVRVPRPEHWPPADTSRDPNDNPETVKAIRELMGSDVSFGWLLDEPWFWNEIRSRVLERVRCWSDSSAEPDRLKAISDLGASLKRISPEDPDYRVWEAFCRASHKTEAQWVSFSASRALQRKLLDPNGAYRFVLSLFDAAVDAQVDLVRDSESAAGCEAELRNLASGSLVYLENILTGTCDSRTIAKWRSKLELELLQRFGKAKERALEAAQLADARRERERVPSSEMHPAADHSTTKPVVSKTSGQPVAAGGGAVRFAQVPTIPDAGAATDKGNLAILRGTDGEFKRAVTVMDACRFGGVSRRAIEKAVKKNSLASEGEGPNRRIIVRSLLQYFPPENSAN